MAEIRFQHSLAMSSLTRMELRMSCVTVAYIHYRTTSFRRVQRCRSLCCFSCLPLFDVSAHQ